MKNLRYAIFLGLACFLFGCTQPRAVLGSKENPVKLFFVPSVDANVITTNAKVVKKYLEDHTPYHYDVRVPNSYVAVIESFGTNRADVASLNTFGYIAANQRFGTEARILLIRHGLPNYRAQILAHADGPVRTLQDIDGRKFAYVDPASFSGYLLPAKLLADQNIKPSETVFAQKHDNVVTMIYQKQVDAGATFYSPPVDGKVEDARRRVLTQFPDVLDKVKIIELTEEIPNDPLVFRKEMPEAMKVAITDALMDFMKTDEGREAFYQMYGATDFQRVTDAEYNKVREILNALGKSAESLIN